MGFLTNRSRHDMLTVYHILVSYHQSLWGWSPQTPSPVNHLWTLVYWYRSCLNFGCSCIYHPFLCPFLWILFPLHLYLLNYYDLCHLTMALIIFHLWRCWVSCSIIVTLTSNCDIQEQMLTTGLESLSANLCYIDYILDDTFSSNPCWWLVVP